MVCIRVKMKVHVLCVSRCACAIKSSQFGARAFGSRTPISVAYDDDERARDRDAQWRCATSECVRMCVCVRANGGRGRRRGASFFRKTSIDDEKRISFSYDRAPARIQLHASSLQLTSDETRTRARAPATTWICEVRRVEARRALRPRKSKHAIIAVVFIALLAISKEEKTWISESLTTAKENSKRSLQASAT